MSKISVVCKNPNCDNHEECSILADYSGQQLRLRLANRNFDFKGAWNEGVAIICKSCRRPVSMLRWQELQDF